MVDEVIKELFKSRVVPKRWKPKCAHHWNRSHEIWRVGRRQLDHTRRQT